MISYRIVYQPTTKIFGGYVFISIIFFHHVLNVAWKLMMYVARSLFQSRNCGVTNIRSYKGRLIHCVMTAHYRMR